MMVSLVKETGPGLSKESTELIQEYLVVDIIFEAPEVLHLVEENPRQLSSCGGSLHYVKLHYLLNYVVFPSQH
jgi:hypothetical protein